MRTIAGRGDRDQLLDEGRRIGRRYGSISAAAGLTAPDAVEAFLFFRTPVIQAVTRFIEEEDVPPNRALRIFAEMTQFLDQVLIATVAAHADAAE